MENGVVIFQQPKHSYCKKGIILDNGKRIKKVLHSYFLCSKCHIVLMAAGYIFHNPHLLLLLFLLVGSHYSNVKSNCDVCRNLQWVSVLAVAFGGKCEICADTTCPDSIFQNINVLFYCQRDGIADKKTHSGAFVGL